jgi:hypothetical protein
MVTDSDFQAINTEQLVTRTDRALYGALRRSSRLAFGTSPGSYSYEDATVFSRRVSSASHRSSIVILSVAAALTWLAVALICLLA